MGRVTVQVNGRSYALTCDDGQEPRIRRLAQYVDAKMAEFVARIGKVAEARLLLLAALVIADELSDANETVERERNRGQAGGAENTASRDSIAGGVQGMENRAEAIAARLEAS
jgi:cell division protein ZapA